MTGRTEKEIASTKKMQEKLKELPKIFSEFYYYMCSTKSYTTVERYVAYVREFAEFLNDGDIPNNFYKRVAPLDINKYFAAMKNKESAHGHYNTSDSIRATKWSALNTFFGFLKSNNYIANNPMERTERPKVQDRPDVAYLTEEEIRAMLDNVNKLASTKMKNRDLAIIMLGLTTGLRVSALTQIDISDIDFENNTIKVIEKRGKTCNILIGDKVKEQIELWLQDRKKYFSMTDSDALFISSFKKRITRDGIRVILEKYSKGVINKHVTPHVLRHSCATNLYEKTGDIYLCATVLNHKNIATTMRYANMSKDKKQQAANILDDMI